MSQLPTICLIHGHGVDASIWDSVYADLALDHAVLTPDFARLSTLTTIESYADELYDVLQAANVEKAILVGHSMGGYMALALAEQHPELVQGLVLYHSTATADDDAKREARQQVIKDRQGEGNGSFSWKGEAKKVGPIEPTEKRRELMDILRYVPDRAPGAGGEGNAGPPNGGWGTQRWMFWFCGAGTTRHSFLKTKRWGWVNCPIQVVAIAMGGPGS